MKKIAELFLATLFAVGLIMEASDGDTMPVANIVGLAFMAGSAAIFNMMEADEAG